jgi:hypothetical protein
VIVTVSPHPTANDHYPYLFLLVVRIPDTGLDTLDLFNSSGMKQFPLKNGGFLKEIGKIRKTCEEANQISEQVQ